MIRAGILVVSLAVLSTGSAFAQAGINGDWDVTLTSPQGTNSVKVSLTQDGETVKGLFKSQMGELPFTGTLAGTELKFNFSVPFQGQAIEITMTGKVNGEGIDGTANFGGMAEGTWTAKRAPAPDPAVTAGVVPPAVPTVGYGAPKPTGAAGQWEVTFKTPNGDMTASAALVDNSGKLSGTLASAMGEMPVSGTFEGNALTLSMMAQTPQGAMAVTLTGDVDGDQITNGKAEIAGMGTFDWTAKRKQ